jgi:OPA family glycerol-3-phosphate transporter-like MFS transporter
MPDPHLARWQRKTAISLFAGYAGYYICRSNLSIATPLILAEFADQGVTKNDIGFVASVGVGFYALGKISNGLLADQLGGRQLFLFGLFASVVCTLVFGVGAGITMFAVTWAFNRFFQSMGWVALVKTASRWFPVSRHATIMAFLSLSFLLGDAFARLYLGLFIWLGESFSAVEFLKDWRAVFFIAAATSMSIGLAIRPSLKSDPSEVGADEPAANPVNVYGEDGQSSANVPLRERLLPLFSSPLFWMICLTNLGLTLIRETFNFWTPTFLVEVAELGPGDAAIRSLLFPLVGAVSAILGGTISDRLGGRHGRVMVPSILCLTAALAVLASVDLSGRPTLALFLISTVSFFLIAPYSYLSGVMALDLGGKRASSTVAGLSDSAGYLGAILSGQAVGVIAERYGWSTAFGALSGVCALTAVSAIIYWIIHERMMNRETLQEASHESDSA